MEAWYVKFYLEFETQKNILFDFLIKTLQPLFGWGLFLKGNPYLIAAATRKTLASLSCFCPLEFIF
jgi:hypothetical protein